MRSYVGVRRLLQGRLIISFLKLPASGAFTHQLIAVSLRLLEAQPDEERHGLDIQNTMFAKPEILCFPGNSSGFRSHVFLNYLFIIVLHLYRSTLLLSLSMRATVERAHFLCLPIVKMGVDVMGDWTVNVFGSNLFFTTLSAVLLGHGVSLGAATCVFFVSCN